MAGATTVNKFFLPYMTLYCIFSYDLCRCFTDESRNDLWSPVNCTTYVYMYSVHTTSIHFYYVQAGVLTFCFYTCNTCYIGIAKKQKFRSILSQNKMQRLCVTVTHQEAKYVESWPNTTSAWAGWSRFDIPVDRHGGVHSLLQWPSKILGSPTCN